MSLRPLFVALSLLGWHHPTRADTVLQPEPEKPKTELRLLGGMENTVAHAQTPLLQGSDVSDDFTHKTIAFTTDLIPGSVLVRTSERRLYFILEGGKAIQYSVGVGREGFAWTGRNVISRKAEWPDWRPPHAMIAREAQRGRTIPALMVGGPTNPLGARALYIGDTEYRIHGTNDPGSIGRAMSSGCIRMMNAEVIDLYSRVMVGATAVVE